MVEAAVVFLVEGLKLLTPKAAIGAHYFPISKAEKNCRNVLENGNSKSIKTAIKFLKKNGIIIEHKGGEAFSLNPQKSSYKSEAFKRVVEKILAKKRDS
ncbi:MAG: hypothetical protein D6797_05805 [Bdellovibrio sp.]|nr:MAG: hypothetical protein D6797_05805 [Bdellovibrio sp.]